MNILITGGCGYIGYLLAIKLINKKHKVFVVDNMINGKKKIKSQNIKYYKFSYDNPKIMKIIKKNNIQNIYHLAGFIDSEESVFKPKKYFKNNVDRMEKFLKLITSRIVQKINIFFASSAAVYGATSMKKIKETQKCKPLSPYGYSKLMGEKLLYKFSKKNISYISFRFFNVAGADHKINHGPENKNYKHLLNKIKNVKNNFVINGKNYHTKDGTCVRDFVHIKDVVDILIKSRNILLKKNKNYILNLCSGKGSSVKQVVNIYKKISKENFKIQYGPRRKGDPEFLVGQNKAIKNLLNHNFKNITQIIKDLVSWKNLT